MRKSIGSLLAKKANWFLLKKLMIPTASVEHFSRGEAALTTFEHLINRYDFCFYLLDFIRVVLFDTGAILPFRRLVTKLLYI